MRSIRKIRRINHAARHSITGKIQQSRSALYLLPDRPLFHREFRRSGMAGGITADPEPGTRPVALRAYPFLRHAVLLLRLQHGGDQEIRQGHPISRSPVPRNRPRRRPHQPGAHCAAISLGRGHADLSQTRRYPPPLCPHRRQISHRRRCRNQLRGRPARTDPRACARAQGQRLQPGQPGSAGFGGAGAEGGQPRTAGKPDPRSVRLDARGRL